MRKLKSCEKQNAANAVFNIPVINTGKFLLTLQRFCSHECAVQV